jgi:septum site-determining protein MinC
MAAVSAGAEVIADGNVHVYGALRGRALAGVRGNEEARIFCTSQEAELVAIAGQFMVDEVLRANHWKETVQIYLENGKIQLSPLPKNN